MKKKVIVTLYGSPLGGTSKIVSGLEIWQEKYLEKIKTLGFEIVEFYFTWHKSKEIYVQAINKKQYIFSFNKNERRYYIDRNKVQCSKENSPLELLLTETLKKEKCDAIIMINWISTGMILWQSAMKISKPIIFTPTEYSSICHTGFLLHVDGSDCSGPDGGKKCSNCTYNTEPLPSKRHDYQQWKSKKFWIFYKLVKHFPMSVQKRMMRLISSIILSKTDLLSEEQSVVRFMSVKYFIQLPYVFIAFQSNHQHNIFEKYLDINIHTPLPKVINRNKILEYFSAKDIRQKAIKNNQVKYLFAARSDFDRGLQFLLDAWEVWCPEKEKVRLIIRCNKGDSTIDKSVKSLQFKGCDIDMEYGVIDNPKYLELHREVHFVVNPSMWQEPLSGTVIEGLSLGTPAIVPTSTGSASFIENGYNGFKYKFRSQNSLISCLKMSVENINSWNTLHFGALKSFDNYLILTQNQFDMVEAIINSK